MIFLFFTKSLFKSLVSEYSVENGNISARCGAGLPLNLTQKHETSAATTGRWKVGGALEQIRICVLNKSLGAGSRWGWGGPRWAGWAA